MAKCYIHGKHLRDDGDGCKQACLKVFRDQDKAELSISFDNNIGAMKDECRRIEAVMFDGKTGEAKGAIQIDNSDHLCLIIQQFLADHL